MSSTLTPTVCGGCVTAHMQHVTTKSARAWIHGTALRAISFSSEGCPAKAANLARSVHGRCCATQSLHVSANDFRFQQPLVAQKRVASAGSVKRVGRCDSYATEFDLEAEEYVPMPKGDVHKKKEIVQVH